MPTCKSCNADRAPSAFYESNKSKCKDCVKTKVRAYRQDNLEKVQAYDRQRGLLPHRKAAVRDRAPRYAKKKAIVVRRYQEQNPEKRAAQVAVGNAIRDGKLKPQPCERCGYGVGVHGHHEDYSKPLEVNWLCARCHGERHREINEERRKAA